MADPERIRPDLPSLTVWHWCEILDFSQRKFNLNLRCLLLFRMQWLFCFFKYSDSLQWTDSPSRHRNHSRTPWWAKHKYAANSDGSECAFFWMTKCTIWIQTVNIKSCPCVPINHTPATTAPSVKSCKRINKATSGKSFLIFLFSFKSHHTVLTDLKKLFPYRSFGLFTTSDPLPIMGAICVVQC